MYCTCVHIYALYIHVSQQELDTCYIVATGKNLEKTTAQTEKSQECARDQFQQKWRFPKRKKQRFRRELKRVKGNRENVSPQKTGGKWGREGEPPLSPSHPTAQMYRSPTPRPWTPHDSRTLHLHHSIKHIKKYTVSTRSKIVRVCVTVCVSPQCRVGGSSSKAMWPPGWGGALTTQTSARCPERVLHSLPSSLWALPASAISPVLRQDPNVSHLNLCS